MDFKNYLEELVACPRQIALGNFENHDEAL